MTSVLHVCQYDHREEEDSAQMLQSSRQQTRKKKRRRTESRKRVPLPSLPIILQTLFLFGIAAPSYLQAQTQHLRRAQALSSPSSAPTSSLMPSQLPSLEQALLPSVFNSSDPLIPSTAPSIELSEILSLQPSLYPSLVPSQSRGPSQQPSDTLTPSLAPSFETTLAPSRQSLAPSEPISFRTGPCTADPEVEGYEEVGSLLADLVEYQVHQSFILCPNTTFDDMEIIIGGKRTVPLTLSCGGVDCLWMAASDHHLIVTDPNANLTFTGITFMGAGKSSILLKDGAADMHVHFENCAWTENSGNETILMEGELTEVIAPPVQYNRNNDTDGDDNSTDTSSEVAVPARYLQETGGLLFASLVGCRFFKNSASKAIVVSSRANLLLESCTFDDNFVGSLLVVHSGAVNLQLLRMESNFYTDALIAISENATLATSNSICALSNTPPDDGVCQGILVGDICEVTEQCVTSYPSMVPSLAPSEAPSFAVRDCYNSLEELQNAIDDATSRPDRATIRVCAGTVLDCDEEWMYSPLIIETDDIRFECGETGKLSDQCLFHGGDIQVHIGPGVQRVLFSGFSMVNARQISVLAAGSSGSEALFDHCQWRFNTAIAGVLVYNEAAGEKYTGQRNLEQLVKPSSPSMSVTFDTSFFEDNDFSYSSVACVRADVFFKAVVFKGQGMSRLGAIGATQGSEVGVSSSCFIDNEALLEGIIVLDATSNITRNVQNFGKNNGAILGACVTVFNDRTGTCAIDGTCQGDCLPFTATSCSPFTLDVERPIGPTPPPAAAPTPVPELPPSLASNETDAGNGNKHADESGSSGPSGVSIAVAVMAALVILVVGWWCFRKGRKKKGGGKKKPKKSPSFKGSTPSRSLRKVPSKKKKKKRHDDFSDSSDGDFGDDDGFYDEDVSESLMDRSSKKDNPEKGSGWFRRGSVGKEKKEKSKKGKKGKKKKEKAKKTSRRRSSASDDDSEDDDNDDDYESDPSDGEEDDNDSDEEEEEKPKPKRWKGKKKGKTKKEKKKKVKKEKSEQILRRNSSSNDLSSSFGTAAQKAKGAAVIASVKNALS